VREDYRFDDGLFSGYDADKRKYDKTSWNYELDENGFAKRDTTLQHPRCVWNLLKEHVSRYTPDVVENICGTPKADFLKVCEMIAETSVHDKTASFLYALGWTQHSIGAQNIRTMAMVQLLLGNMGMAGGGVNALRGHSCSSKFWSRPKVNASGKSMPCRLSNSLAIRAPLANLRASAALSTLVTANLSISNAKRNWAATSMLKA
jgi:anaerobic selenocysteine-containing dehydrogenase